MKIFSVIKRLCSLILIFTIVLSSAALDAGVQQPNGDTPSGTEVFRGRWQTDNGSQYEFRNGEMICISVHEKKYLGWVGRAALTNFHEEDGKWYADQAIRWHNTGSLSEWKIAQIELIDSFSFMKKVFDKDGKKSKCCKDQLWKKVL